MKFKGMIAIVTASFVSIAAVSGRTSTSPRTYRTHFLAPADANQKISESDSSRYAPPRSPGFNDVTGS
jgi:hypothetical protein